MESIREGWLVKSPPERHLRRHWKLFKAKWRRRYFVLYAPPAADTFPASCSAILDYYADSRQKKKRGTIDLTCCEEVLSRLDSALHRHVFGLRTVDGGRPRTYYLAADSGKDMDEWVSAMCWVLGMKESNVDESLFSSSSTSTPVAPAPHPRSSLPLFSIFGVRGSDGSSLGPSTPITSSTLPHPRNRGNLAHPLSQTSWDKRYQNGLVTPDWSTNGESRSTNSEARQDVRNRSEGPGVASRTPNDRPRYCQTTSVPQGDRSGARSQYTDGYLPPKLGPSGVVTPPPRPGYNTISSTERNGYKNYSQDGSTILSRNVVNQMSPLSFVPPAPNQSESISHCLAPPIHQKPMKSSSMNDLLSELDASYDMPRSRYNNIAEEMKGHTRLQHSPSNRLIGTGSSSNLLDDVDNRLYNVPRVNYVAENINVNQTIIEYLYPNQPQSAWSTYDRPPSSDNQSRDSTSMSTTSDYDMPSSNRISPSDVELRQIGGDYDIPGTPSGEFLYSRPRNIDLDPHRPRHNDLDLHKLRNTEIDSYRRCDNDTRTPLTLNGLKISGKNPFVSGIFTGEQYLNSVERDSNGNHKIGFLSDGKSNGLSDGDSRRPVQMRQYTNAELLAMSPPVPVNNTGDSVHLHSYMNAASQLVPYNLAPSNSLYNTPGAVSSSIYCNQLKDDRKVHSVQASNQGSRRYSNIDPSSAHDYSSFQSPTDSQEVIELPIKFTKRSKSFKRTVPCRSTPRETVAVPTRRRTSLDTDDSSGSDSDSESSGGIQAPSNGKQACSGSSKPKIRISVHDIVPPPALNIHKISTNQQRPGSSTPHSPNNVTPRSPNNLTPHSPNNLTPHSPNNLTPHSPGLSGVRYLDLELEEGGDMVRPHSGRATPTSPRNSVNVEKGEQRKSSVSDEVTDYKEIDWCRTKALNEMRNVVENQRRESCD